MKKMLIYKVGIFCLSFYLFYSPFSHAAALTFEEFYTLKKNIGNLRVRSGPGMKYSTIGNFTNKDIATISSSKMNGNTPWVKVEYGEIEQEWQEGWVSSKHLLIKKSKSSDFSGELYKVKTKDKNGKLNVRKGAGSKFQKLKTLINGTSGLSIKEAKKVEAIWWVKISYLDKVLGWVNSQYLDSYSAFSHTVLYGDTMQSIARKYEVTWLSIAEFNQILPPYNISAGKVIEIPMQ